MAKKVLLVTENLKSPYDEGIKKTVFNLFVELDTHYELKVICREGFKKYNIHIIQSNKIFLSKAIKKIIQNFRPDSIIYFPFQSATFASYLRLFILRWYAKKSKKIFIALQPKPLKKLQKLAVNFIKPPLGLTPSPMLKEFWDKKHIKNKLLPLLTDTNIFKPLSDQNQAKKELRKKYNIPYNSFIISHMGHLNEGRNLKSLIPLQKAGYQVLIVGSSSTPADSKGPESLKKALKKEGIIILDNYIKNIEEIYQLSDIYIFPVEAENSSIGMPLSVLEARACGIPVVTTDYGSLKNFLGDDYQNILYTNPKDFLYSVKKITVRYPTNPTKTKIPDLNKQFYKIIHEQL